MPTASAWRASDSGIEQELRSPVAGDRGHECQVMAAGRGPFSTEVLCRI